MKWLISSASAASTQGLKASGDFYPQTLLFLSGQWQVTLTAVFNSIDMWPIVLDCLAIDFT